MSTSLDPNIESPAEPQAEHTFFYRDNEVPAGELQGFGVLVPFARDVDSNEGEAFREEEELLEWVAGREQEPVVRDLWERLQRVRVLPEQEVDNDQTIARRRQSVEQTVAAMRELADETGLPLDSAELFDLATRPQNPLEVPIFDPVSFFTGLGSSGFIPFTNWLPLGGGFWRLAWFGWSNRPRSWRYSGWVWAFDGEFWSGASVLSGWFPIGFGPLSNWGMDRRVSSVIVA